VKRYIRIAYLFIDFGTFIAYIVKEVSIAVDVEGYFEKYGYIEVEFEVDFKANIK
jgi:hypothetical protein